MSGDISMTCGNWFYGIEFKRVKDKQDLFNMIVLFV